MESPASAICTARRALGLWTSTRFETLKLTPIDFALRFAQGQA